MTHPRILFTASYLKKYKFYFYSSQSSNVLSFFYDENASQTLSHTLRFQMLYQMLDSRIST